MLFTPSSVIFTDLFTNQFGFLSLVNKKQNILYSYCILLINIILYHLIILKLFNCKSDINHIISFYLFLKFPSDYFM